MARKKADPIAKLIWAHMTYAQSFESSGMHINGVEVFYDKEGNSIDQPDMQTKCEKHMESTIRKIRKAIAAEGEVTIKIN